MALQEFADKLAEAWGGIFEKMEKLAESFREVFDEVDMKIEECKRLMRRPPKWYIKANTPAILVSRNKPYHCRNNC